MADEKPKKKKRLVKNPETFREKALKASESNDKEKRSAKPKRWLSLIFSGFTAPIRRLYRKLHSIKFLRPVFKIFNRIGKILLPTYFRKSFQELKLVHWPSWKQSRQLTFAVLVFAIVFGAAIALVDFGLDKLFRQVLLK